MSEATTKICQQCHATKQLSDFAVKIQHISTIPWRTERRVSDICRGCENDNTTDDSDYEGDFWSEINWFTGIFYSTIALTGLAGYLFPAFMTTWFFKIVMGIFAIFVVIKIWNSVSQNDSDD